MATALCLKKALMKPIPVSALLTLNIILYLLKGVRVRERGIYQWIDKKFEIPSCGPTIKSGITDVWYVLKFQVLMRCGPDLVIPLPVTIGTVPHISSMGENQEQQDHQEIQQNIQQNEVQESKSNVYFKFSNDF